VIAERGHDAQFARIASDWFHGRRQLQPEQEGMIFAPTREAAEELNEHAQAHMRHHGLLGEQGLVAGDRTYWVGDRVMCLENRERDLGVLNGRRGTVTAIDTDAHSLHVDIDGRGEVMLPGSYIEDGNVALGYAMTVHKSQGMTCERAYVAGSEDLYRELAYTALTRHRDRCRFYLNAGEPTGGQLELEVAGEARDRVLARAALVMGRERTQQMALDVHERDEALRALPDADLVARAGRLEQLLATFPAQARAADARAGELQRQAVQIRDDERRLAASRQDREDLGARDRRRRAEVDQRIGRQQRLLERAREGYADLAAEVGGGKQQGERWLEAHGVELAEASVIERELAEWRARTHADAIARAARDPASDLSQALGARPASLLEGQRWDAAARAAGRYRLAYGELPGPDAPCVGDRRRAWVQAERPHAIYLAALQTDTHPDLALADQHSELDLGP